MFVSGASVGSDGCLSSDTQASLLCVRSLGRLSVSTVFELDLVSSVRLSALGSADITGCDDCIVSDLCVES